MKKRRKVITGKQITAVFNYTLKDYNLSSDVRSTLGYIPREKFSVLAEELGDITAEEIAASSAFKKIIASLPHKLAKAFRSQASSYKMSVEQDASFKANDLEKRILIEMLTSSSLPDEALKKLGQFLGFVVEVKPNGR